MLGVGAAGSSEDNRERRTGGASSTEGSAADGPTKHAPTTRLNAKSISGAHGACDADFVAAAGSSAAGHADTAMSAASVPGTPSTRAQSMPAASAAAKRPINRSSWRSMSTSRGLWSDATHCWTVLPPNEIVDSTTGSVPFTYNSRRISADKPPLPRLLALKRLPPLFCASCCDPPSKLAAEPDAACSA